MKNSKRDNATPNDPANPLWCAQCYLRIAPYERRTIKKGKSYHQVCYAKAGHNNKVRGE